MYKRQLDAARRADFEDYFSGLSDRDRATLTRVLGRLVDDRRAPGG